MKNRKKPVVPDLPRGTRDQIRFASLEALQASPQAVGLTDIELENSQEHSPAD